MYLLSLVTEHGQPDQITTSLVPQWNSLVFFEVTPVSFHQVCKFRIGTFFKVIIFAAFVNFEEEFNPGHA